MDYIEVSGKNVDEALTNALIKLETTSDKVEYEVIEKGSAGFLGIQDPAHPDRCAGLLRGCARDRRC